MQVPFCSLREGFDSLQRDTFINMRQVVTENVPYIPRFTRHGFTKTKLPVQLYRKVLLARQASLQADDIVSEQEAPLPPLPGVINYHAGVENRQLGQSKMVFLNRCVLY